MSADFDAIYEDDQLEEQHFENQTVAPVPDPMVLRGAGNMTV